MQSIFGSIIFLICYFLLPGPPARGNGWSVNINYVHGLSDQKPQTWVPPLLWLSILIVGFPLIIYWPTHLLLQRIFPGPR